MSSWKKFFMDAGIPSGPSNEYANVFTDNRMQMDMLKDLTKDILHDLGVTIMGDVLAILRHGKKVSMQTPKERHNKTKHEIEREKDRSLSKTSSRDITSTLPKNTPVISQNVKSKAVLPKNEATASTAATKTKTAAKEATKVAVKKASKTNNSKPIGSSTILSKATVVLATTPKSSTPRKTLSQRFSEVPAVPAKKAKPEQTVVRRLPVSPVVLSSPVREVRKPTISTVAPKWTPSVKKEIIQPLETSTASTETEPARQVSVFARLDLKNESDKKATKTSPKQSQSKIIKLTTTKVFTASCEPKEEVRPKKIDSIDAVFKRLDDGSHSANTSTTTHTVFRRLGTKLENDERSLIPTAKATRMTTNHVNVVNKPLAKNPIMLSAASQINSHLGINKPVKHVKPVQSSTIIKNIVRNNEVKKGVFGRLGDRR